MDVTIILNQVCTQHVAHAALGSQQYNLYVIQAVIETGPP